MRLLQLICFLILIPSFSGVLAQGPDAKKWTRLEMKNHEFSVVFPPGYLVDTAEGRMDGRVVRLFGAGDNFSVSLSVIDDSNADERLKRSVVDFQGYDGNTFTAGKFNGKRLWPRVVLPTMHQYVYLASDSHFYTLSIYARDMNGPEIQRILCGIKVNGKPVYVQNETKDFSETEPVVIETLRSSPEVNEAYGRKYQKRDIKVTYEPVFGYKDDIKFEKNTRPAVILERDPLRKLLPKSLFRSLKGARTFTAKLRVNLLANGEVGDITVFSDEPREYQDACVESLRRAKFVPAVQDGKNVDMVLTDSCVATLSLSMGF